MNLLFISWRLLRKRSLRTGLTLLQIIIGIASITVVLSLIYSMVATNNIERKGILEVMGKYEDKKLVKFAPDPIKQIGSQSEYIEAIDIAERESQLKILSEGIYYQSMFGYYVGTEFFNIAGMELKEGNFFTQGDIRNQEAVIMISEKVNKQLFGESSGVGKDIILTSSSYNRKKVKIIGIFKENGALNPNVFESVHLCLPYTFITQPEYYSFWVLFKTNELSEVKTDLERLINHEYRTDIKLEFTYRNEKNLVGMEDADKTFSVFIGIFGIISIVITSIGILSMLLVSIVEQNREIGLRRAFGASRLMVIKEIITQSMFISMVGGILGIGLAVVCYRPLIDKLFFQSIYTNYMVSGEIFLIPLLIAFVSVLAIGFVVGLYPAWRASQFEPVEVIQDHA